jgi:hypothetical protein
MDQIFEEYVEMDESPCNLTLVSRTWWSLALANPWLWRYIVVMTFKGRSGGRVIAEPFVELRHIGPSTRIWTRGKAQVCQEDVDFVAAVDRSGSVPLHITDEGTSLIKQILTLPISSRVAVLDINGWRFDICRIMAQITLGPFTQLTQLRSKIFHHIQHNEFIRTVRDSAPLLKILEFNALADSNLTLLI